MAREIEATMESGSGPIATRGSGGRKGCGRSAAAMRTSRSRSLRRTTMRTESPTLRRSRSAIIRSTDGGRTWSDPEWVDEINGDNDEPALIELAGGDILCVMRTNGGDSRWWSVSRDKGLTWTASEKIGFPGQAPYLFRTAHGVLLLGRSLDPARAADDELLQALVAQAVMHLKNADSYATISSLNDGLERQNEDLRSTIAELTRARDQISTLEAAGRRIAAMVHSKAESVERVRAFDFLMIVVLSLGMALAFNTQNPRGIPLVEPPGAKVETIGRDKALELVASEDALLVDARPREFFERESAPGAVNVPAQLFDLVYMMQMAAEDPERPVVVFGRSVSRHYDLMVARKFLGRDHERVYVVTGVEPADLAGGAR